MNKTKTGGRDTSGYTRRHFMQASAALGSQALVTSRSQAQSAPTNLQGYTGAPSVVAGGTLDFYLRDPQALTGSTNYPFSVTRIGWPDTGMLATTVNIGNQVVPADASTNGCRWTRSLQLSVPAGWPSGQYFAYVGSGANACTVPFVVRPASPTPGVKTLVQVPVTTVHAYNEYGGKSLYDYNSSGGVRASRVSLDRPLTQSFNSFFDVWSQYLVRWLAKNGLAADFCTDLDIVANPGLLAPYQLYVQAGHDEYWSLGRRNTMDAFVARGGNAAFLGGNTSWFQARLEPSASGVPNRTLVCYKSAAADPVVDPALKTDVFSRLTPPNPENITTGLGFATGCSWAGAQPRPNTPSVVARPEHWALAGTGLGQGAGFGGTYVGYECDSAAFVLGTDGRPYAIGTDGTPATLRILANADGSTWNAQSLALGGTGEQSGYAMVAVFSRGGSAGTVFNAGSTDWAYGLRPELDGLAPSPISRITLNVLTRLARPWAETADVRQFRRTAGAFAVPYYTTDTTLPAGAAWWVDGWAFHAFTSPVPGSAPVYRYRSASAGTLGTRYRYSRSATLAAGDPAWVADGTAFSAYASATTGSSPVYEHFIANAAPQETLYLYSTSATPPSGWSAGGVVFHAPAEGLETPALVPAFTLALSGTTLSATQGKSATTGITIVPANGFTGTVSFSATGLPAGTSATFTPASSTLGTTLTLGAGASTPVGNYMVNITAMSPATATAPALTVSASVTLVVTAAAPPPSFTLSPPSPGTLSLTQGQAATSGVIAINALNGFAETVNFSASGVPAGTTAVFLPAGSKSGTQLALTTTPSTPPGTYTITVVGASAATATLPALSASTTLTLVVAAAPSYALSASPSSLTMIAGGIYGSSSKISVVKKNGFAGTVQFSVSGVPSGMNYRLSTTSSTSSTTLSLVAQSYWAVRRGTYTITIRGTSGSLAASTTLKVTVTY